MMKINTLIGCAVAAAIAGGTTAARATDITAYQVNQAYGRNVNVFISGSTAIDNTINVILNDRVLDICQYNTVTEYQDLFHVLDSQGNPIGGATETLWYCQAGANSGMASNLYIAIFKESTAGSINGAQPLITVAKGGPSGLTFLNATGPDVQNGTCAGPVTTGACTAGDFLQNVTPTGGVSDVEANLLRTIPGGGTLSTADVSKYLAGAAGLDRVWGVPVTKNLYYALQSAEGLTPKCPAVNGTQDSDSPTCAPSLSKQQVGALFDRDINSWKSLGLSNPSGDNTVYICREDVGAGTEAAFEAYLLGARCSTSSEMMAPQDGSDVFESASGNGVLLCLRAFDQGHIQLNRYNSDYGTSYSPFTPAGDQWAIGIASTELTPAQITSYAYSDTLRMIAVDGVLPTLENVVNGYDPFWTTDAWYTIKSGDGVPSGAPLTVFKQIQRYIGAPAATSIVDSAYINVWGDGGDLAPGFVWATSTTYSSYPPTPAMVEANPVNLFTKAASGGVNNCDTPELWSGASGLVSHAETTLLGSGDVNQGP